MWILKDGNPMFPNAMRSGGVKLAASRACFRIDVHTLLDENREEQRRAANSALYSSTSTDMKHCPVRNILFFF